MECKSPSCSPFIHPPLRANASPALLAAVTTPTNRWTTTSSVKTSTRPRMGVYRSTEMERKAREGNTEGRTGWRVFR